MTPSPKVVQKQESRKSSWPLPLVLEIIPGQAAEGILHVFEPGTYEESNVRELVKGVFDGQDWSVEELETLDEIREQMEDGVLLCGGQMLEGSFDRFAQMEETEDGEKYYHIAARAVKPQEGV